MFKTNQSLGSLRAAGFLLAAALISEMPLSAYTDPGSGTLAWQILVGGLVGLGFEARRIKSWITRKFLTGHSSPSDGEAAEK